MEDDKVLIVKKKETKMQFKIRPRRKNAFAPDDYLKVVNLKDPNSLALLFEDLDLLEGAPVERAYREYQDRKSKGFPF